MIYACAAVNWFEEIIYQFTAAVLGDHIPGCSKPWALAVAIETLGILKFEMTEYKIYKSPWKAIKLALLSSVFVIGGIYMLYQPSTSRTMAWSTIIFFGLGFPLALYQLFDRRPQIIINEIGILDRTIHSDFINWEIIEDAYLVDVHGQKFICLVVDQLFEPSRSKGVLRKQVAGLSKVFGFQELNINLSNVNIDAQRLTEFILAMRTTEMSMRASVITKIKLHI